MAARWRPWIVAIYVVVLAVTQAAGRLWTDQYVSQAIAATAGLTIGAGAIVLMRRRRVDVRIAAAVTTVVVAIALVGLLRQERAYEDGRFANRTATLGEPFAWAQTIRNARIGIAGFFSQYPFYGPDLSNRVQFIGDEDADGSFAPARDCTQWRELVDAGRFDYVVVAPYAAQNLDAEQVRERGSAFPEPPEARWTRTSRATREVLRAPGRTTVFRVDAPLRASACSDGEAR
jgi:hypothetical protein